MLSLGLSVRIDANEPVSEAAEGQAPASGGAHAHACAQACALFFGDPVFGDSAAGSEHGWDGCADAVSPVALALALATSRRFLIEVAEPALDGGLGARRGPVRPETACWVDAAFGLAPVPGEGRLALLARVLESPALAPALAVADVPWSAAGLGLRLRLASATGRGGSDARLCRTACRTARDHLAHVSRGLAIVDVSGIEPERDADGLRFLDDDPWVAFTLDHEVAAASPYCRIDFGLVSDSPDPMGTLYLDYGEGDPAATRLGLAPRGRTRYAAFVVSTGLKALRWKLDDSTAQAAVTMLTARPVSTAAIAAQVRDVSGQAGVDRLGLLAEAMGASGAPGPLAYEISRILTRDLGGHVQPSRTYLDWIRRHELRGGEARRVWRDRLDRLPARPRISVLVPTYDTDERALSEMIDSVLAQVYPDWELCIADDASRLPHVRATLEVYAARDPRIKLAYRPVNGHISAASNTALELVEADWVALLDHDDALSPHALLAAAEVICACPDAQLIYSDEDKLDLTGARTQPFFKPDYSPELFLSQNYFNHLTIHRTANIKAVGGWRVGLEGSQDYDLNLRILERIDGATVRHIPEVLYHWRILPGSTALDLEQKRYAVDAGRRAISEHLTRVEPAARVEVLASSYYRVRHALPVPPPLVSLIVPTRDRADLLAMCVGSILSRSTYPRYEVLIIDNGSVEDKTRTLLKDLARHSRVRVLRYPGEFNYSSINNFAVAQARGEIIGLVNNDVEVISSDWLEELVSWAAQSSIGCVGAKLYYSNGEIQHAGVILGIGGVAGHSHKYSSRESSGYFSRLHVTQNLSAVTGACLFVKKSLYELVGGLDDALRVAFNDVDLCLKVSSRGYRNVFTPFAELYHHESMSRGRDNTRKKVLRFNHEIGTMRSRWGDKLSNDPYYSRNLSRVRENFDIRWLDE